MTYDVQVREKPNSFPIPSADVVVICLYSPRNFFIFSRHSLAKPDCYDRSNSRTTAVERFVLSSPEVGWAISASGTAKGMNLITYKGHA